MDAAALLLFVEIVEAGSLSAAAARVRRTRANVSYHLARLEKDAGTQLLRRTTRRMELTEAGQRLHQHGKAMQQELLAARESVAALAGTPQGRLRVSVPSGYGQLVMAQWLVDFKCAYPGVVLDVAFDSRTDDDMLRGEQDFVVRVMPAAPDNLVARWLGEVRYVACAAPSFARIHPLPQNLADLVGMPVLTSDVVGRELRLAGYRDGQREEVPLTPTVLSENFVFLRDATLAGIGIGIVPDYVVQCDIAEGRLLTCLHGWRLSIFGAQMYLLYMPNRRPTRAASAFIDFIVARQAEKDRRAQEGAAAVSARSGSRAP